MTFFEDVFLYDLNCLGQAPLAYRSASGGAQQPDLRSLLGISARKWREIEPVLYDSTVYLAANGGAVLLGVQGSIGRYALVVKTSLSLPALAYLVQCAGQVGVYVAKEIQAVPPRLQAREREAAESAARTVAALRLLIHSCKDLHSASCAEECITQAAELMGVELMPSETAEYAAMQAQGVLPEMRHEGHVLLVCLLSLLSAMRNRAHARSGWLYAVADGQGYAVQAVLRCAQESDLDALAHLRAGLEDSGVAVGALIDTVPIVPPKQYAYLQKKITDPRKPLCARCGCLDARCTTCMLVRWAVLPYVCDAALQGIKPCRILNNKKRGYFKAK